MGVLEALLDMQMRLILLLIELVKLHTSLSSQIYQSTGTSVSPPVDALSIIQCFLQQQHDEPRDAWPWMWQSANNSNRDDDAPTAPAPAHYCFCITTSNTKRRRASSACATPPRPSLTLTAPAACDRFRSAGAGAGHARRTKRALLQSSVLQRVPLLPDLAFRPPQVSPFHSIVVLILGRRYLRGKVGFSRLQRQVETGVGLIGKAQSQHQAARMQEYISFSLLVAAIQMAAFSSFPAGSPGHMFFSPLLFYRIQVLLLLSASSRTRHAWPFSRHFCEIFSTNK